jgi:hypothetical protein
MIVFVGVTVSTAGCAKHRASVTAVPLSPWNRCEPEGIPYYLPKPLLIIAKNVRHIDESKIGLTNPAPIPNGFDNQASYADVKANVTVPSATGSQPGNLGTTALTSSFDVSPSSLPNIWEKVTPSGRMNDGLAPDYFYTYQIVFVPDLSQKYGLRIRGGPGEIRAAMNLVNGWMYTGLGPFYIKDSSTAQNIMSAGIGVMYAGRGVADVLNEVSDLARTTGAGGTPELAPAKEASDLLEQYTQLARSLQSETRVPQRLANYAEIHIYEPMLAGDGAMTWQLIAHHSFDREYFQPGLDTNAVELLKQIISADSAARQKQPFPPVINPPQLNDGQPERAPAVGDLGNDPLFDRTEAGVLGVTTQSQVPPPETQVNVNVNTPQSQTRPHKYSGIFRRPEPPSMGTKVTRYVSNLPFMPGPSSRGGIGAFGSPLGTTLGGSD